MEEDSSLERADGTPLPRLARRGDTGSLASLSNLPARAGRSGRPLNRPSIGDCCQALPAKGASDPDRRVEITPVY
jgi:hypothetical protein